MAITTIDSAGFEKLFRQFIRESFNGKRTSASGKRISDATANNYTNTFRILLRFQRERNFQLCLHLVHRVNQKDIKTLNVYWRNFMRELHLFLYHDNGYYDNYAGSILKCLKVFYNYLLKEKGMPIGQFHKRIFVPKEEVEFVVLSPEEVSFLTSDKEFESTLTDVEKIAKDIFVFGCTVGLRVSDLLNLRKHHLKMESNIPFLVLRTRKTDTAIRIQLPGYALEILKKYRSTERLYLLPHFSNSWLNKKLKLLGNRLNSKTYIKTRHQRGKVVVVYKDGIRGKHFTFGDMITSHTMRRTGITNLLRLGVPEQIVRKFSGHSPGTKEFYRYVSIAESYMNSELQKAFEQIAAKTTKKP